MKTNKDYSKQINILGEFCGLRDVPELRADLLKEKYGISQADIMVLFGGSILCGGDVLAKAMQENIAKHYIIVGGAGHTTQTLRDLVHHRYPDIDTKEQPEAKVFSAFLKKKYDLQADFLECESTNCGNNITYLLDIIEKEKLPCGHVILSQDATMQHRMCAGMKKYRNDINVINFATYQAKVEAKDGTLQYAQEIDGMWQMDRYISLLMGEIPRLTDDAAGYGPMGKDFIAHVEMPQQVREAFAVLKEEYGELVRVANPLYASFK